MASVTMSVAPIHSINPASELNLMRMVNLALSSSPKVGIVNFNILKTFLIELLKALNLQNFEPKLSDEADAQVILEAMNNEGQHEALIGLMAEKSDATKHTSQAVNKQGISILTNDMKPLTFERFHVLEDKLARLEQQIASLNALPSNQQIIDKSKDLRRNPNSSAGPIMEVWQYTQLSKRLESNEDGITKLTSLLEDLIGDITELKDAQAKNASEISSLNQKYESLFEKLSDFERFKETLPSLDQLKSLENDINALRNNMKEIEKKITILVSYPDLEMYVTWPALENAMKGMRDAIDSKAAQKEIIVQKEIIEIRPAFTQTTPQPTPLPPHVSTPVPPPVPTPLPPVTQPSPAPPPPPPQIITIPPLSRPSSSMSRPSRELQEILQKLGTLDTRHELLKEEVEKLRNDVSKRPAETPSVKLPDDFAQKLDDIKRIKAALEELTHNFNIETNKRMQMENILSNLNSEIDSFRNSIKDLLKNSELNRDEIASLKETLRLLDESKADKDWVRSELERKADRIDLDQKASRRALDDTHYELSHSINNCIQKHSTLEDEWRKSNESMLKDLESKLDRLELDSLKEYIEKQLKKLKKLQKENIQPQLPMINPEDEAAGLKKQLLRFHCISCDRPIDLPQPTGTIPSLPAERGIRPIQTPRPYTTYELDQIRQFQKQQIIQDQGYDMFATLRPCGGHHTLTIPQKKLNKIPQTVIEDQPPQITTSHRNEVHIQGQDGHIYKGRIDARLSVEMKKPKIANQYSIVKHHNERAASASSPNLRANNNNNNNNTNEANDEPTLPVFTNS